MRKITEIIVHCTATRPGQRVTAADVDRWHRTRGFAGIGYHYLVMTDGTVCPGRPLETPGAHCLGHNAASVGVCYVGGLDPQGLPADTRNAQQREALLDLLKELKRKFPAAEIHGHRDYAAKACPCFDATAEYSAL